MNLYNNLKSKVYLGLILVLASIPVHASSETWAQNLDLTIPSLEMPSTSALDSKAKQEIMMGFECCWDQKHIKAVHLEHSLKSIEYSLKENPNESLFTRQLSIKDPIHPAVYYTFWALQIADIATTTEGMKWDCVYEGNPLLPSIPHRDRLILHKLLFLSPLDVMYEFDMLTYEEMIFPFIFTSYVVHNNLKVIDSAEKNCSKR